MAHKKKKIDTNSKALHLISGIFSFSNTHWKKHTCEPQKEMQATQKMRYGAAVLSRRIKNRLDKWSQDVDTIVHKATRMESFASISSREEFLSWTNASDRPTRRRGCRTAISSGSIASGIIRKKRGRLKRTKNGKANKTAFTKTGRSDSMEAHTMFAHEEQFAVS